MGSRPLMAMQTNSKESVTFFSLPRELRDAIYRLALVGDEPIDLWPDKCVRDFRTLSPRKCRAKHCTSHRNHTCRVNDICRCEWAVDPESLGMNVDEESDIVFEQENLPISSIKTHDVSDCPACHKNIPVSHPSRYIDVDMSLCQPNNGFDLAGMVPHQTFFMNRFGPGGRHWQPLAMQYAEIDFYYQYRYVRDQHGLRFIRKQLAAGLLRTCKQLHNEAAAIFWRENHFRFSGQDCWQGLLRFFLTIGRSARQFITSLDVGLGYERNTEWNSEKYTEYHRRTLDGSCKNDPKLHMAKFPPEMQDQEKCFREICKIMVGDGAIKHLNLIVTAGTTLEDNHDWMCNRRPQRHLRHIHGLQINVVVEKGAFLNIDDVFHMLDVLGWSLTCHPGSYLRDPDIDHAARHLRELYVRKSNDPTILQGVSTMFGAEEEWLKMEDQNEAWANSPLFSIDDVLERLAEDTETR